MLITHTEAISIADYFSLADASGKVTYRPTVHFAYHACDNAWMSMHQVAGREWVRHPEERLMVDEIAEGRDELGVLLMGHKKGAYWFGSDLTIHKTRELVHFNNATSLQVCTGVLTGVVYAYENPRKGQQTHPRTATLLPSFLPFSSPLCVCDRLLLTSTLSDLFECNLKTKITLNIYAFKTEASDTTLLPSFCLFLLSFLRALVC
jgi:hypothetical protein